jgi:hypothetical protein
MRVDLYFFISCMLPLLQRIKVDEAWYLRAYPDVQEAIENGIVTDPQSHYCRFGFFEHRMPYRIAVDELWYLAQYPDVSGAIARQDFASGQAHFDLQGFREGRLPYPNFRLGSTVKSNGKVQASTRTLRSSTAPSGTMHIDSTPY